MLITQFGSPPCIGGSIGQGWNMVIEIRCDIPVNLVLYISKLIRKYVIHIILHGSSGSIGGGCQIVRTFYPIFYVCAIGECEFTSELARIKIKPSLSILRIDDSSLYRTAVNRRSSIGG